MEKELLNDLFTFFNVFKAATVKVEGKCITNSLISNIAVLTLVFERVFIYSLFMLLV